MLFTLLILVLVGFMGSGCHGCADGVRFYVRLTLRFLGCDVRVPYLWFGCEFFFCG